MSRVLILIGGHLSTAPRPQKEAATLAKAGYEVTVNGVWSSEELADRDELLLRSQPFQFKPFIDFRPGSPQRFLVRARNRMARELYRRLGRFSPELLGYAPGAMLRAAMLAKADLTIVHSEAGLWVGERLLKEGFQVGVDFEDWFSEDLLPEARLFRPIKQLKRLETRLACNCRYSLTTSQVLADALSKSYDAPKPTVIYNTFPWSERKKLDGHSRDRKNRSVPSLHWFSQTIGPGRGLEILMQALALVQTPVEVHLRGSYSESTRQWLEPLIPKGVRRNVFTHPTVPNDELPSRITEHDIGLALEYKNIPSRNLTVTNKLFQYLLGGLAVIATDTAGQLEVMSQCPEAGEMVPADDAVRLARAIDALAANQARLNHAKAAALEFAENKFCWEKQGATLVAAADAALKSSKRSHSDGGHAYAT